MSTCKSWLKYSWEGRHCEDDSWEADPEGLCILHSLKTEKDSLLFEKTLKDKLARQDFDFREVFFPGPVSFAQQHFKEAANFQRAHFAGWADFHEAEFAAPADFSYAKFSQAADFNKTKFDGPVQFVRTEILGEADFRGSVFNKVGLFQQVNGSSPTPFEVLFQEVKFGPGGRLIFQDQSLERARFLGTDVRRLQFDNVRWPVLHGRQIIFDEMLLHRKEGPHLFSLSSRPEYGFRYEDICAGLEKLYRYLKLNYEQEGDLKQAGDFHYGELEMHRRANPWRRRFPLSWYNMYWALSGYGERPLRALAWLLGLLCGMGLLMSSLGLENASGERVGFGSSLIFLLEQATLLRPAWAAPATAGAHVVSAVSRIMLPAQAALFILALRNRLGRRR
ncbi:MAG: pentapeptide repeat-containing protein [Deltaproteobacteria bacterium]|nr:pentapeptide repeat-containing protein [Deltaproteobacteria bacterium]